MSPENLEQQPKNVSQDLLKSTQRAGFSMNTLRGKVAEIACLLGLLASMAYAFLDLRARNYPMFYFEVFLFTIFITNYIIMHLFKRHTLVSVIVLFLIGISILGSTYIQHGDAINILFISIFPFVAFFLLGKKWGLISTVFFNIGMIFLYLLFISLNTPTNFFVSNFLQVFICLAIMSVLSFYYQYLQEYNYQRLRENERDLNIALAVMEKEREERLAVEKNLATQIQEVEKKNKALEDTKKAILNLLEDAKNLQEDLQIEKDRIKDIINAAGDSIVVVSSERTITLVNPATEKILGLKEVEVLGKRWDEVLELYRNNKKVPLSQRPLEHTLKEGVSVNAISTDNFYLKTPKGMIPVSITSAPLKTDNKIIGAVDILRDVSLEKESRMLIQTEVEERTKQLKEEHARLESSINSLNIGFLMTDSQGQLLNINNMARKLICCSYLDEYGKKVFNSKHKEDLCGNVAEIQSQLGQQFGLASNISVCRTKKESHQVKEVQINGQFLNFFFAPILVVKNEKRGTEIEVIGVVVLIDDVTDDKMQQRSRDEFFSIASHELRTPLTAIRGNTFLIKQFYEGTLKSEPDLSEMVDDIHKSSIRLIDIVNDFLDMSRLEQGKIQYNMTSFDPVLVCSDVIKEYEVTGSRHKIAIHLKKPDRRIPNIFADRDRVKQVLINLLGNALKFTEKGSITISIVYRSGKVSILVTDTGKGISKENQKLLFKKFQQATDNLLTRDTTKGTGLGLYISRLMLSDMGGEIELDKSVVGRGSTFKFTLPIATKDQPLDGKTREKLLEGTLLPGNHTNLVNDR